MSSHGRSQSDSAPRCPRLPSKPLTSEPDNPEATRAVESSPDLPPRTLEPSNRDNGKSPRPSKSTNPRNATLSREPSFRAGKDSEQQVAEENSSSESQIDLDLPPESTLIWLPLQVLAPITAPMSRTLGTLGQLPLSLALRKWSVYFPFYSVTTRILTLGLDC